MSALDTAKNVFVFLGVIGILLGLITFIRDSYKNQVAADPNSPHWDKQIMGYFAADKPSMLAYLFGRKTIPRRLPKVQKMIEFGDDLLYTSSILDQMPLPASNEEASWVELYSAIIDEIARRTPPPEGTRLNFEKAPIVGEFVTIAQLQIKSSETQTQDLYSRSKRELIRCGQYFDGFHSELDEKSGGTPNEVDPEQGHASSLWLLSGKPSIKLYREELCGLALMLGIPLGWHQASLSLNGEGAFGISLSASQRKVDSHLQLRLIRAERRPRHCPSKGSGYTFLFAKYMACGMIPFARASEKEGQGWIKSVYVSSAVLKTLKRGGNINDSPPPHGKTPSAIEYFRRLPTSKFTNAWPHYGTADNYREENHSGRDGIGEKPKVWIDRIENREGEGIGSWWKAVGGIAFGGLVPQTTQTLKDAVIFALSGLSEVIAREKFGPGDPPGDQDCTCVSELEQLVDKVHLQTVYPIDQKLNLFGQYVADRDAAAVFGRYMTLLERLTALCGDPEMGMEPVFERTCELLGRSYEHAVATALQNPWDELKVDQNLGRLVRTYILQGLRDGVDVGHCAWTAVCIIAAWAANVQIIRLRPYKGEDDQEPEVDRRVDRELIHEVALEAFPRVFALG